MATLLFFDNIISLLTVTPDQLGPVAQDTVNEPLMVTQKNEASKTTSSYIFIERQRRLRKNFWSIFSGRDMQFSFSMFECDILNILHLSFQSFCKNVKIETSMMEEEEEESDSSDEEDDSEKQQERELRIAKALGLDEDFLLSECPLLLKSLGIDNLLPQMVDELLYFEVNRYVEKKLDGEYETHLLHDLLAWVKNVVMNWAKLFANGFLDSPPLQGSLQTSLQGSFQKDAVHDKQRGDTPCIPQRGSPSCDIDLKALGHRLENQVLSELCRLRIADIYNIITDPESLPAVQDLQIALQRTDNSHKMVKHLAATLRQRLLHPGAETSQVLEVFIDTIKVLRVLDSTGILLEAVSGEIKGYLRGRKDTIRCIVASLTNTSEGTSDLLEGLVDTVQHTGVVGGAQSSKHVAASAALTTADDTDDEEEITRVVGNSYAHLTLVSSASDKKRSIQKTIRSKDQSNEARMFTKERLNKMRSWTPDPIEADPQKSSRSRKSDILAMLIGIYGTTDIFVSEYRAMLSTKLLQSVDYDVDTDVQTLELLKLKFGEEAMSVCEIMIKDVDDSRRLNKVVKDTWKKEIEKKKEEEEKTTTSENDSLDKTTREATNVDALIYSKHFWPSLTNDVDRTLQLHPLIKDQLAEYEKAYEDIKKPRKLDWNPSHGLIEIEISDDSNLNSIEENTNDTTSRTTAAACTTKTLALSPLHATIVLYLADNTVDSMQAETLASKMGLAKHVLAKKILSLINQGIIVEKRVNGRLYYGLVKTLSEPSNSGSNQRGNLMSRGAESGNVVTSVDEDEEEGMSAADMQAQQDMVVYEKYIMGMLTNYPTLQLSRIHNFLKMFVSGAGQETKYDKEERELKAFLAFLQSQGKVVLLENGLYKKADED
eukprot:g1753.t1